MKEHQTLPNKQDAPPAVACSDLLGACVEYIKAEIVKAEQDVKFRDDSYKTWRSGTDASWREVGCFDSKEKRLKTSDGHGRIAIKCRRKLEILKAVLAYLQAPNDQALPHGGAERTPNAE